MDVQKIGLNMLFPKTQNNIKKSLSTLCYFEGPFVIGKIEVDGDPIEAYGGITVAARQRFNKKARYFSELVPGGETSWKTYRQKVKRDDMGPISYSCWSRKVKYLQSKTWAALWDCTLAKTPYSLSVLAKFSPPPLSSKGLWLVIAEFELYKLSLVKYNSIRLEPYEVVSLKLMSYFFSNRMLMISCELLQMSISMI